MSDFESSSSPVQKEAPTDELKVYRIFLYVRQFRPEDICVKLVNADLVISGKHNEQLDLHGFVTREFKRRFAIPEEFEPKSISSIFDPRGILKIFILRKNIWEEFNKVKGSIFRGYINLHLLGYECQFAALTRNGQISLIRTTTHSEDTAKKEIMLKTCSVPLDNTNIQIVRCNHLIELKGDRNAQQQSSKSKDSATSPRQEQVAGTLKSSIETSCKSAGSHELAEASELSAIIQNLNFKQPGDHQQVGDVPDDHRQTEAAPDNSQA